MNTLIRPKPLYSKPIVICLIVIIVAMGLASIHPLSMSDYLLHQAGTLISVGILLALRKWRALSDNAFIGATLFLLIHIVGARYLYSYTPYSEWTQAAFGFSLDNAMGWHRNMYDRLVHFCYGLCLFGVFYDVLKFYFPQSSRRQLVFLVIVMNMATSLVYEWIEWALAMTMSPEDAEAYNGQQGDMWDAHKDMFMAFLGGILAIFLNSRIIKPINQKSRNHTD